MKIEVTNENLTKKLAPEEAEYLISELPQRYDELDDLRLKQIEDIRFIREAIYDSNLPATDVWATKVELPEIYELSQTLKSHISENLYSQPEAMFDVSGTTPQTQMLANRQKAMLVNTFERMKIQNENWRKRLLCICDIESEEKISLIKAFVLVKTYISYIHSYKPNHIQDYKSIKKQLFIRIYGALVQTRDTVVASLVRKIVKGVKS